MRLEFLWVFVVWGIYLESEVMQVLIATHRKCALAFTITYIIYITVSLQLQIWTMQWIRKVGSE